MTGTRLRRRRLHEFLATFAWDQYYFPMDGSFQNYTYFKPMGLEEVKACWRKTLRLMREGRAPKEVGVYLHWPFCPSQCTYCYCSMRVPEGSGWAASYAAMLKREMDEFRGIFEGTRFGSVWLGGGTPTYMPQEELDGLLAHLRKSFELQPGAQVYVEASPATLTAGKMEALARHGVNRMTLGVQSLDAEVLKRIDRVGQTRETVERAWELVKRWPGILTDIDVLFGLEGQSSVSFVRDLGWAVGKGPDAIHLYGFDPRAQTLFARGGGSLPKERREEARRTAAAAERLLTAGGYRTARVDALSGADLPEERQDGAVRRLGASVLGLGHSAISHAFGSAWYHHPLVPRSGKISRAMIPAFRAMRSGLEEEMRGYALRHLGLYRRLSRRAFAGLFGRDLLDERSLAAAFRDLQADGLVRIAEDEIVSTCRDEVESLIGLKRLYSPRVSRALLQGRRRALARFLRDPARHADGGRPPEAVRKIADRGLFRVYFRSPRAAPARRAPAGDETARRRTFLSCSVRSDDYPPKVGLFNSYAYFPPARLSEIRGCWEKTVGLMKAGRAPKEIGVYVHWPFCPSRCTYCYCSMRVPSGRAEMEAYLGLLEREIDALKGAFNGVRFGSVWLGGGTPTFMTERQLDRLLGRLRDSFELDGGAQVYAEASPATLTAGKMDILLNHGVNRMTLGVQSLEEGVLRRIDRAGQTRASVERAWSLMEARPGLLTDVDMIFGLEGQSGASFVRDLGWAVKKGPDAIHVYGFDPRSQTAYARAGGRMDEARREDIRRTAEAADRLLTSCGYRTSRTDPEKGADAPEERQDGELRRLGASVLGLGAAAKSHAYGAAWYEHRPSADGGLDADGLLPFYALKTSLEEEERGFAIRHLNRFGAVSRSFFRERFGRDVLDAPSLGPALRCLAREGALRIAPNAVSWAPLEPVDRAIALKGLYGEEVVSAVCASQESERAEFDRAWAADPEQTRRGLRNSIEANTRFMVYYRAASRGRERAMP